MFPSLYAILDSAPDFRATLALAESLASAGVRLIQLRAKRASSRALFEQSASLTALLAPLGVRFIVNDRADVAALVRAGGVHVGQDDLPVADARRLCPFGQWVGVSTHNLDQFRAAAASSADYIAVGPIFSTATKENPDPVVGLEFIRAARALSQKPLVAIGGIKVESAGQVYAAGADSIAVIRDLAAAADPAARSREYLEIAARRPAPGAGNSPTA
ncbi:MAG: thiamine phosphate synthase [Candidatus Acidiferrales bacterium]